MPPRRLGARRSERVYATFTLLHDDIGVSLRSGGAKLRRIVFRDRVYNVRQFVEKRNYSSAQRAALIRTHMNDPPIASLNSHSCRPLQSVNISPSAEKRAVAVNCYGCAGSSSLYRSGDVRSVFDPIAAGTLLP